ncbi:MAG: DUF2938 family protein [Chromatiales bacterium]|nr:DUF2938 family protein [Chromatiales bacterium]
MNTLLKGALAGLAATIVLSMLMIMKGMMGLMPDVDIIAMLAGKMGGNAMMGWVAHFMIGVVGYGIAYALVFSKLAIGSHLVRGIALGIAGWLSMMVALMPMMGAGMFGMDLPSGMMVPVATMMLHIIFGATLGFVYSKL